MDDGTNSAEHPFTARSSEQERLAARVADLEIRTILTDALGRDPDLRRIDAQSQKQVVTLSGTVDTPAQKSTVLQLAWQTPGVQSSLYSTRVISLKRMQVHSKDAVVTLSGTVPSRAERLLAGKVSERVEGVRKLTNNLAAPDEGER